MTPEEEARAVATVNSALYAVEAVLSESQDALDAHLDRLHTRIQVAAGPAIAAVLDAATFNLPGE